MKSSILAHRSLESGCAKSDGRPTTDCRREEICESAKRRKATKGLSGSTVGKDVLGADEVLLGSEGGSGGDAITHETHDIDTP